MSDSFSPQRHRGTERKVIFEMSNGELTEEQGRLLDAIGSKLRARFSDDEGLGEIFVRLNLVCGAMTGRLIAADGLDTKPARTVEEVAI